MPSVDPYSYASIDPLVSLLGIVPQFNGDQRVPTPSLGQYYAGPSRGPTYSTQPVVQARGSDSSPMVQAATPDPYASVRKLEAPMTADTFSQFEKLRAGAYGDPNAGSSQLEQFMNYLPRLYPELLPVASDYLKRQNDYNAISRTATKDNSPGLLPGLAAMQSKMNPELGLLTQAMNVSPARWEDSAIPGLSISDLHTIMDKLGPYAYAQGFPNGEHRKNSYPNQTLLNDIGQYGLNAPQTIAAAKQPNWLWNEGPSGLQRLGGLAMNVLPTLAFLGAPFLPGLGPAIGAGADAGFAGAEAATAGELARAGTGPALSNGSFLPGSLSGIAGTGARTLGPEGLPFLSDASGNVGQHVAFDPATGTYGPGAMFGPGEATSMGLAEGGTNLLSNARLNQGAQALGQFGNLAQGLMSGGQHGAQPGGAPAQGGGGLSQAQLAALTAMNDERHRGLAPTFEQRAQGGRVDTGLAGGRWIQ